jgi:hypothetical protein
MNSFKNNIKKSALSFKVIVVCLLLSGSLIAPGYANGIPVLTNGKYNCNTGELESDQDVTTGYFMIENDVVIAELIAEVPIDNTCTGDVIIPNGVTSIGDFAFVGSAIISVNIPNSVTTIEGSAFYLSSDMTSVTIGNSVTSIGASAFQGSDLRSVIIPNSVASIGDDAFRGANALASVRFLGNAPAVGTNAFLGVASGATAYVGYNATDFVVTDIDNEVFWEGLLFDVGSNQYGDSWQKVEGALTADDEIGKRLFDSGRDTWVDTYELVGVPADVSEVSIYVKSNNTGTGLCDPALVIYDLNDPNPRSSVARAYDDGFGGEDPYDGNTCGKDPAEYYDAFLTASIAGEIVSNFRIQVSAQGIFGVLDEYNSGAYTLYVSVGRAVLISTPGSDSSPTTKTITPVVVKNADSITNMKNKTYLSKKSMKSKLRENNLFKYSASDSFKYQVFKSSKKSCGMRGNYVMRYENSKTCDLYITRTNSKGISNKYWVKINYSK